MILIVVILNGLNKILRLLEIHLTVCKTFIKKIIKLY